MMIPVVSKVQCSPCILYKMNLLIRKKKCYLLRMYEANSSILQALCGSLSFPAMSIIICQFSLAHYKRKKSNRNDFPAMLLRQSLHCVIEVNIYPEESSHRQIIVIEYIYNVVTAWLRKKWFYKLMIIEAQSK